MKNITKKIIRTTKILLLLIIILSLKNINIKNENDKVINENINKTLDLKAMAMKYDEIQREDIYYPLDTFTGDLTGYSAYCPLCGGHLGCTGQDVRDGTLYYNDSTYGNIRIVASSKNLSCGSIVKFVSPENNQETTAIVLDRGVVGNDLDLLVPSQEYAIQHIGRHKITYNILRFGWTR